MKTIKIVLFLLIIKSIHAQQESIWNAHQTSFPNTFFNVFQKAAFLPSGRGALLGVQAVNYYSQSDCNGIYSVGWKWSDYSKWGAELGWVGNEVYSSRRMGMVGAQRITKEIVLGAKVGMLQFRFPERSLFGYSWEMSASFSHHDHFALFWIQSNGPSSWWVSPPQGGCVWTYAISKQLMASAGIMISPHQHLRCHFAFCQQSKEGWNWYCSVQPQGWGVSFGAHKQWSHLILSWGISRNALTFPSFQSSGIYVD